MSTSVEILPERQQRDNYRRARARIIATFAIAQVLLMVGSAIYRLTPLALEPILDGSLTPGLIAVTIIWVVFNAYAEGYRGFQKRFSPRTVARAAYLGENPKPLDVLLALPFSMGLYFANRRQLIVSWVFLLGLTALIAFVRALPQPYRGIIDAGVVIGLGWGALSLVYSLYRYLSTGEVEVDPELPEDDRRDKLRARNQDELSELREKRAA